VSGDIMNGWKLSKLSHSARFSSMIHKTTVLYALANSKEMKKCYNYIAIENIFTINSVYLTGSRENGLKNRREVAPLAEEKSSIELFYYES
jgi:hypothetical protein